MSIDQKEPELKHDVLDPISRIEIELTNSGSTFEQITEIDLAMGYGAVPATKGIKVNLTNDQESNVSFVITLPAVENNVADSALIMHGLEIDGMTIDKGIAKLIDLLKKTNNHKLVIIPIDPKQEQEIKNGLSVNENVNIGADIASFYEGDTPDEVSDLFSNLINTSETPPIYLQIDNHSN